MCSRVTMPSSSDVPVRGSMSTASAPAREAAIAAASNQRELVHTTPTRSPGANAELALDASSSSPA
jgi:hypothetical protein